jgi:hypothetical protein
MSSDPHEEPQPEKPGQGKPHADDVAGEIAKGGKEAGEAFANELIKGMTAPDPAGDPEVMGAFALGWQMSELYRPGPWAGDVEPEVDLPGLGSLGGRERALLGLNQISVGLKKLEARIRAAGLEMPDPKTARQAVPVRLPNEPYEQAIFELHVSALTTLTATNFKLGKAYGLGRALADTTRLPKDLATLKGELEPHRVANLINWLSDLTSQFPPHAGHVVHDSLEAWRDWATASPSDPEGKASGLLRRQGQRWRSLLSGEKAATDALKIEDYVKAGELALTHTRTLALGFITRFKLAFSLAALLFLGGLALVIFEPTTGSIAGGLAGILASLGLSWKGIGGSLGATSTKLERPVWEGALDTQLTASTLLIPGTEAASEYTTPAQPKPAQVDA